MTRRLPLPKELSHLDADEVYEVIVPLMHCMDEYGDLRPLRGKSQRTTC
ncbi:MAG: hypothetical protein IJ949_00275 [Oscillospiraceae bacterium]|nr:hypothetical protein [Oscillospiraceae bacterium]